jgi:phosphoglycerate kinase
MSAFRTLDDAHVDGKRVLVRVDLNVPMENGRVSDATRIERAAPTITEIAGKGGKVILISHFGRPKGRDLKESLKLLAAEVSRIVGRPVAFAEDCIGQPTKAAIAKLKAGDVLLLENTRFHAGEERNDPAFARELAALADIYVNDGFSVSHRAHASVEAVAHLLPAYAGRSMQAELDALTKALEAPQRPVAAIVGGAKVSTKLALLANLIAKVNVLIIGGGMANTFLAAQGKAVGKSLCEHELAATARDILAKSTAAGCEIVLPVDAVVAQKFEANAPSRVVDVDHVGPEDMILDIGPRSVEHIISVFARVKTLVWNGPLGAFELPPFDNGTVEAAEAAADSRPPAGL